MSFEIALFALGLLISLPLVRRFLRHRQDPGWEERWNQLPQLQRERIAMAVRRGEYLQDPEEAELGAALARRQRATSALFAHPWLIHLVLASFLLLIALVGGSPLLLLLVLLLLAFLIWVAYRERVTKRNLERAERAARH